MESRVTIEKIKNKKKYMWSLLCWLLYNRPTQGTLYVTRVTQYQCLCDLKN